MVSGTKERAMLSDRVKRLKESLLEITPRLSLERLRFLRPEVRIHAPPVERHLQIPPTVDDGHELPLLTLLVVFP